MEWVIGLLLIVLVVFSVLVFVMVFDLLAAHLKLLAELNAIYKSNQDVLAAVQKPDDLNPALGCLASIDTRLSQLEECVVKILSLAVVMKDYESQCEQLKVDFWNKKMAEFDCLEDEDATTGATGDLEAGAKVEDGIVTETEE